MILPIQTAPPRIQAFRILAGLHCQPYATLHQCLWWTHRVKATASKPSENLIESVMSKEGRCKYSLAYGIRGEFKTVGFGGECHPEVRVFRETGRRSSEWRSLASRQYILIHV